MTRDDEALSWAGDDDPTLIASRAPGAEEESRAQPAIQAEAEAPTERPGPRALRWLSLVLALAATAGWVVIVVANPVRQPNLTGLAMYQLGEVLAVFAPLAWWFAVYRFAPATRASVLWCVGLVVTAPWPLAAGLFA